MQGLVEIREWRVDLLSLRGRWKFRISLTPWKMPHRVVQQIFMFSVQGHHRQEHGGQGSDEGLVPRYKRWIMF
jgi:hypothetical protein